MKKKFIACLLSGALALSALAGCGGKKSGGDGNTLTYWMDLNSNVSANYASMGDTPYGKALMEQTGIQIEYQHPPVGQINEQFSLLLADGDLPDIMEYAWINYPGGPQKAIDDGYILALNEVFEKYCPNITAYLKEHPDVDKAIKTDAGNYYCFPFIRGDEKLMVSIGSMVRGDLLKELGMETPETLDEWHAMLTAFKEKGMSAPFTYEYSVGTLAGVNPILLAHGGDMGFYLDPEGVIKFGAVEESYKKYLETAAQWYAEGLIDTDIASVNLDQVSAKITSGLSGASVGYAGSRLGVWTASGQATTPGFELIPTPTPVLNKGDFPERGQIDTAYVSSSAGNAAITTSCKNVEMAARLLDYGYGEAGHMLCNFGVEGVSYNLVDNYPKYSEEVMENPEGIGVINVMSAYTRAPYNGPFVQDVRYVEQYYSLDAQQKALDIWSANNAAKYKIPNITATSDESKELSTIMNEINTYRDEMTIKFILGNESLDNFDSYVQTIQGLGLDRALEIQNAALARYQKR